MNTLRIPPLQCGGSMMKRLIALLLLAPVFVSAATAQDYTVTFLGTLGGADSLSGGISNAGYVTGYSNSRTSEDAFLWKSGTMTDLGSLTSEGEAVNASGEVVGLGSSGAFLYRNGTVKPIANVFDSLAFGINNAGTAVGYTVVYPCNCAHPFIYKNGTLTVLGIVGTAFAINNRGQVVGDAELPGEGGAFLYQHGVITNLGVPVNGSFNGSDATDISENGKFIVGYAAPRGIVGEIAFLDSHGKMIALGTLGGATSLANGVNNSGEVVGESAVTTNSYGDAFLYRNGKMIDLNSLISPNLGIQLLYATGINDTGWIAATARNEVTGQSEAVLLKPSGRGVPEPATLSLFALGLFGLAMRRQAIAPRLTE